MTAPEAGDPAGVAEPVSQQAGLDPRALPRDDDAALMFAHCAGDPQAFTVIFRRYRAVLFAVAVRILRNHHDAEDALSDALVRALRSSRTFRGDSAVLPWLRQIVTNVSLDHAARRRKTVLQAQFGLEEIEGQAHVRSEAGDDVASRSHQLVMEGALATLPEDFRRAFLLVALFGFSLAEVADLEQVAVGTVKSRVWRARALLADQVANGNL